MAEQELKEPPGPEDDVRMSFGEHLEDLRRRVIKSVVMLLFVILALMMNYDNLFRVVTEPQREAWRMLLETRGITDPAEQTEKLREFYFLPGGPHEAPITMIKMAFILGLFISSPWIGYQLWAFIAAGLYRRERKYVTRFAPLSFFLFLGGCVFGYVVLIPYGLWGLGNMMDVTITFEGQEQHILRPLYSFPSYLNLVLLLTILLGAAFQLPLVMVFLSKVGLVQPRTYHKWRKTAIIINVVMAAVVTPADPYTMLIVAIPLVLLYEVGVVIAYMVARTPAPA